MIAFPLNAFLTTRELPRVSVLYTPGERSAVEHVGVGRDAVYAAIYQNVTGSVRVFRQEANANWRDSDAGLPKGGSTGVVSVNGFGPEAYYSFQDFLTPTTLYANHSGGIAAIKSAPARFDASPYLSAQYEAVSADGTRIPYFVIRAKNATGSSARARGAATVRLATTGRPSRRARSLAAAN